MAIGELGAVADRLFAGTNAAPDHGANDVFPPRQPSGKYSNSSQQVAAATAATVSGDDGKQIGRVGNGGKRRRAGRSSIIERAGRDARPRLIAFIHRRCAVPFGRKLRRFTRPLICLLMIATSRRFLVPTPTRRCQHSLAASHQTQFFTLSLHSDPVGRMIVSRSRKQ
uniref:Uncharacterized protein n=1 Tax=Plectus sambesii TaxID=2011161 RepID=A0A914XHM1_9BILA